MSLLILKAYTKPFWDAPISHQAIKSAIVNRINKVELFAEQFKQCLCKEGIACVESFIEEVFHDHFATIYIIPKHYYLSLIDYYNLNELAELYFRRHQLKDCFISPFFLPSSKSINKKECNLKTLFPSHLLAV